MTAAVFNTKVGGIESKRQDTSGLVTTNFVNTKFSKTTPQNT